MTLNKSIKYYIYFQCASMHMRDTLIQSAIKASWNSFGHIKMDASFALGRNRQLGMLYNNVREVNNNYAFKKN